MSYDKAMVIDARGLILGRMASIMAMLILLLFVGCTMIKGADLADHEALKDMIVRIAQEELAEEGVVMTTKELVVIYDNAVEFALSDPAANISAVVEGNGHAVAKIEELLNKFLPKLRGG